MQEMIDDVTEAGMSSCCGAKVIMDLCMECHEHCDIEYEEGDELSIIETHM